MIKYPSFGAFLYHCLPIFAQPAKIFEGDFNAEAQRPQKYAENLNHNSAVLRDICVFAFDHRRPLACLSAALWLLTASLGLAQPTGPTANNRLELGKLANGASVAFVRAGSGDWGIDISGGTAPQMTQPKPAQIEVYRGQTNVHQLAAGYQSVRRESDTVVATAKVSGEGQAAFAVEDRWKISGSTLSLSRKVSVTAAEDDAGFYSAIRLVTAPRVKWEDVNCLIPGMLYDEPSHAGGGSPAGVAGYRAKRFTIREDYLSAPLLSMAMKDGNWAAVMDMAPKGDTTQAESNGGGTPR